MAMVRRCGIASPWLPPVRITPLETCTKRAESKHIEQSILGKEPERTHTSDDKCSFGRYKLNYSDSEALGWMGKRSLVCVLVSILHAAGQ